MLHGSLFSGIGGIDLGFQWAGIETVWQVERDRFCRRVLAKHFPKAKRFIEVRECGRHNLAEVDIISGGFPCQDISIAGKRAGLDGEQSRLWWEYARIVGELRPAWVLIENVSRLLNTEGDRVLVEMEEAGYHCWPIILGAKEIGATHQRSRTWILCHRTDAIGPERNNLDAHPRKEVERQMATAVESWNAHAAVLAAAPGFQGPDAYARIVREMHGIPYGMDRLGALGNAVVPQIPMLFGCYITQMAGAQKSLRAE